MLNFQKIYFTNETKYGDLDINFAVDEIYIDKSTIGKDDKEKLNYNFLAVGRSNKEAKRLISDLANNKFFLTLHANGTSLFRKLTDENLFLTNFLEKDIKSWNSVFYTLDVPQIEKNSENKLLVVFSSISDLPFNASISRRLFFKNFPEIEKYIPKNTYILRIADVGGVMGSAYLNTKADPTIETRVQELIKKIQFDIAVQDSNIVFLGEAKGATGAMYHGIKMGIKTLAIDPLVSDEYYIEKFNDMHFVNNIYDHDKFYVFTELLSEYKEDNLSHIKLITSINSEQFKYISELLVSSQAKVNYFMLNSYEVKKSSDICEQFFYLWISVLNTLIYGIESDKNLTTNF